MYSYVLPVTSQDNKIWNIESGIRLKRETSLRTLVRFILLGLLSTCWALASAALASEAESRKIPRVVFVLDDQATSNQAILKGFREYTRKHAGKLVRIDLVINSGQTQAELRQELARNYDLIIAVGKNSLKAAKNANADLPIYAIKINQSELGAIYRASQKSSRLITGIYLDQPFERYAAMIKHALPQYRRVGILLSQKSKTLKPTFDSVMAQHGLVPVVNIVRSNDLPQRVLERLALKSDLVIAIFDDQIYSPENIKSHLLTAFRHQIPMVGVTRNFTEVGAIASLYTDNFELGKQAAKYALPLIDSKEVPFAPMYPESFEVKVNYNVLRSFGVEAIEIQPLRQAIQQAHIASR